MMKPSLQVRLSQHLALTPQLQQSIRLLQLSTLELQQEVEQMLEQNPFLESDDDANHLDTAPSERAASEQSKADAHSGEGGERGESDAGNADSGSADGGDGETAGLQEVSGTEFGTTEREDWENGTERDDFDGIRETPGTPGSAANGEDDGSGIERGSAGTSLQDHLRSQMAGMRLTPDDRAALEVLIESLNGDGYLADTLEEIHERLAELFGAEDDSARDELMDRLRCALQWLHSMEPLGVGARSLGECLSLQLRAQARCAAQQVALKICDQHLELLARRDFRRLAFATGADEALVKQAQAMIVMCEPKPGRAFEDTETYAVVPDVVVRKSGRGLKVELNQAVMPKLRINDLYAQAVRGARGQSGNHAGLSARLQEARWFMKNIQQRFDTILRVSKAIVERQKNFFTHGAIAMKPLVLREIADELGLHESTISRVTTNKYVHTPQGLFELKYFFNSSIRRVADEDIASESVKQAIKKIIDEEDKQNPFSDQAIVEILAKNDGIQIARRTVAKYREMLGILASSKRKKLF